MSREAPGHLFRSNAASAALVIQKDDMERNKTAAVK